MPARGRRNAAQQHTLAGGALCGGPAFREACVAAVWQRQPPQWLPRLLCASCQSQVMVPPSVISLRSRSSLTVLHVASRQSLELRA